VPIGGDGADQHGLRRRTGRPDDLRLRAAGNAELRQANLVSWLPSGRSRGSPIYPTVEAEPQGTVLLDASPRPDYHDRAVRFADAALGNGTQQ